MKRRAFLCNFLLVGASGLLPGFGRLKNDISNDDRISEKRLADLYEACDKLNAIIDEKCDQFPRTCLLELRARMAGIAANLNHYSKGDTR